MSNSRTAGRDVCAPGLKSIQITRRKFLTISGTSVLSIPLAKVTAAEDVGSAFFTPQSGEAAKAVDSQRPWYAVMRRCGQTNFNERDPLTMDVNEWADYWAALKVN